MTHTSHRRVVVGEGGRAAVLFRETESGFLDGLFSTGIASRLGSAPSLRSRVIQDVG